MYRVIGKRKKESAQLICNAFLEISKDKHFDLITISEISTKSTISRNTIYRIFDTKDDILEYIIKEKMIETLSKYNDLVEDDVLEHSYEQIYQSYLNYFKIWEREKELLQIMERCNKLYYLYDVIEKSLVNKNSEYIISKIKTCDNFRSYYYAWLSGVVTSILVQWVKHDYKETPKELTEIILALFKSTSYKFWVK